MMYMGASHYYFWKGLEAAVNDPLGGLSGSVEPLDGLDALIEVMCPSGTKVAENCREAFSWGFLFGLEMSQKDFDSFFEEIPKEAKVLDDMGEK
jgi:hypothetical protein